MDWILFLLYSAIWSLAGRGFWGPLQEKRAPLVASFAQCCVSAVFACCCPTVCERLCKDTRDAPLQPSLRAHGLWWPCILSQDPVTTFPQPFPHPDIAHSEFGVWHPQHSSSLCVLAHQPWPLCTLGRCCLSLLDKWGPMLAWANQQTSPLSSALPPYLLWQALNTALGMATSFQVSSVTL